MNKFNKRRGNAVKAKKIEKRVVNKRNKLKEKHGIKKVLVSGKRTGWCWPSSLTLGDDLPI